MSSSWTAARPSSPSSGPSPWTGSPTRSWKRGRWPWWPSLPGRSLAAWWAARMSAPMPRAVASLRPWRSPTLSATTASATPWPPSALAPSPGATRPRSSSRPRSNPSTRPPSRAPLSPRSRWPRATPTYLLSTACSSMPTEHASCSFPRASRALPASPRKRRWWTRRASRIRPAWTPSPWRRAAQPSPRGTVAYTTLPARCLPGLRPLPTAATCPSPPLARPRPMPVPWTSRSRPKRA